LSEIAVDTIGPWTLDVTNQQLKFHALTIIDLVTNLVEMVRLGKQTLAHVALQFTNTWLPHYPNPISCVYDQGGEFTSWAFHDMFKRHFIQCCPTTTKNPQASAICEQMHQAVRNSLRVLRQWTPPAGINDANTLVDTALANAIYVTPASYNSSLTTTPGAMIFHWDMVKDLPFIANLQLISEHQQQLIDTQLITQNQKRISYNYQPGQEELKLQYEPNKMDPRATSPYRVNAVHTNGTITIQLTSHTIELISIRRVKPFKR
jgi:transposase InsO family protein